MATGETRKRNGRMQIKMIAGNDGDSVRERWIDADDPNLMVRRGNVGANVPQGITDAVPPSGVVQNVPPADAVSRGLTGPGMMRGGSGARDSYQRRLSRSGSIGSAGAAPDRRKHELANPRHRKRILLIAR